MKKIRLWWKFEGRYYLRNFKIGIVNLIKWFPIVWKNRDWDYRYTLETLKFKLQQQANYISKYPRFEGHEFTVRDINLAIKLIDYIMEDTYSLEPYKYYTSKMNFIPTDETKQWFTMETTITNDNIQFYFDKYPKLYEKHKNIGKDNKRVAMYMGAELQAKANTLLYKILRDKLQSWWD